MFTKNLIEDLPIEVTVDDLSLFLNVKDLSLCERVSHSWSSIFSHQNIWKTKIATDFDLEREFFSKLAIDESHRGAYKLVYQQLKQFLSNFYKLRPYLQRDYNNNRSSYLAFCVSDPAYLEKFISPNADLNKYFLLALYAGNIHLVSALFEKLPEKKDLLKLVANVGNLDLMKSLVQSYSLAKLIDFSIINKAAESGNIQMIKYLRTINPSLEKSLKQEFLKQENLIIAATLSGNETLIFSLIDEFNVIPSKLILDSVAETGNLSLLKRLIADPKVKFEPDKCTMLFASSSLNLELVKYLLKINPNIEINQDIFDNAAEHGFIEFIEWSLSDENSFDITPTVENLNDIAAYGNLETFYFLLNEKFGLSPNTDTLSCSTFNSLTVFKELLYSKQFNLQPTIDTLNCAADAGNFEIVENLLNAKNNFKLKPDSTTLDAAIRSGNLKLVAYLVNNFNLTVNESNSVTSQTMINSAVSSGNIEMVDYLLDPQNNFDITTIKLNTLPFTLNRNNLFPKAVENLLKSHIEPLSENTSFATLRK